MTVRGRCRRLLWAEIALVAVAAATAMGIAILYGRYSLVTGGAQLALAAVAVLLLVRDRRRGRRASRWAVGTTAAAMLLTPLVWSVVTIAHPSTINPVGGGVSDSATGFGGGRGSGPTGSGAIGTGDAGRDGPAVGGSGSDAALVAWLEQNRSGGDCLAAAFGAQAAAGLIIASDGQEVLPIGGFGATDPVPTLATFQRLVADGELRYVLSSSSGGGAAGGADGGTAATIRAWVLQECTVAAGAPSSDLYDCAPG